MTHAENRRSAVRMIRGVPYALTLNALKTACYQCGAQVVYLRLCINHLLLAVTSIWDHSKGYPKDDGEDDDS